MDASDGYRSRSTLVRSRLTITKEGSDLRSPVSAGGPTDCLVFSNHHEGFE